MTVQTLQPPRAGGKPPAPRSVKEISVAVFSGHSGGHLFPASAFAERWKKTFPASHLYLVTSLMGKNLAEATGKVFEAVQFLPPFPWPGRLALRSLSSGWNFARAFGLSFDFLRRVRPDLAVGFGSYASFPGVVASKWLGIPTLIHEQNRVSGRATQWLLRFADCVTSTFPETFERYPLRSGQRIRFVGLPLRRAILERRLQQSGRAHAPAGRFHILIMGGSQGARRINHVVLEAMAQLVDEEKKNIAVNHLTGMGDEKWVRGIYQGLGIQASVYGFMNRMQELYEISDLAITRSGANTLFELAFYGIPALVVPYPYASSHQSENASYFASRGAVLCRKESQFTAPWLLEQVRLLMRSPERRKAMADQMAALSNPYAGEKLVRLGETLMRGAL